MSHKDLITETFKEALEQTGNELTVHKLTSDVVLLESGLDSLGFAILVTLLEEKLGFDPFTMTDEPIYPNTFGEFVEIYDNANA